MKPRRSLRSRLIVSSSVLLAVVCVVITVITTLVMRSYLMTGLDDRLDALAEHATGVRGCGDPGSSHGGLASTGLPYLGAFGVPKGTMGVSEYGGSVRGAAMVGASGAMLEPTAGQQAALSAVDADGHHYTLVLPGLGAYRVKAVHADSREGEVTVTTGLPYDSVDRAVGRLIAVEAAVAAGGLLLAALAAAVIIGYHLRPLQRVSATAARVSCQPLDHGEVTALERVPDADAGPGTEVGRMAAALNRLLGHVEGRWPPASPPRPGCGASWPTPATNCAPRSPPSPATYSWSCAARRRSARRPPAPCAASSPASYA